jgi:hypothetical protein
VAPSPLRDRRTLLLMGVGLFAVGDGVILGLMLHGWRRPPPAPKCPDAHPPLIDEALKLVRESGLPGIVVVVPPDQETRLGKALAGRLSSADPAVAKVLSGAMWMCVRAADAGGLFNYAKTLMRVDGAGEVLRSLDVDLAVFESDESFVGVAGSMAGVPRDDATPGKSQLPFGTWWIEPKFPKASLGCGPCGRAAIRKRDAPMLQFMAARRKP